jgi:SPFH domain / Band 7 family
LARFIAAPSPERDRNAQGIIGAIVAIVVVVIIAAGSWYTVDQTERGVKLRYGATIGTAQPGLGFKIPLIDSVEKVSVKTITYSWDKMNSYSYDRASFPRSRDDGARTALRG